MTEEEKLIIQSLSKVKILPSGFDKRFINQLSETESNNPEKELSEKQKEWMFRMVYKYRKQIPKTYEYCHKHPHCSKLK